MRTKWQPTPGRASARSDATGAGSPQSTGEVHVHWFERPEGLEIWAPAKLNLFLEVLARRPDGYHEIESLMTPIALFDTLCFAPDPGPEIRLSIRDAAQAEFPPSTDAVPLSAGPDNLVWRAVELVRQAAGVPQGARITLTKRIPVASGLAGGSSDAAAALVAANLGFSAGLSRSQLMDLAARLGSDIPFFLGTGAGIVRGRGERLESIGGLAGLDFVVVRPPIGLSTAAVYKACRPADAPQSVDGLLRALQRGDRKEAGRRLHNQLQPAAEGLCAWIDRLSRMFAACDVAGHRMSGSGTSYFALCHHRKQALALAARLRAEGLGRVYAVASI